MECDAARQLVNLGRAELDELDASEREALEGHLEQCADCSALSRWENQIAHRMQSVPIPADLHSRIMVAVRKRRKPWRKWVARVSAAAAVLALLFLLFWYWWLRPLPFVDPGDVIDNVNVRSMHTKSDVEMAFKDEMGVMMEAPAQFNYQNLLSYGMAEFEGQYVPRLTFFHRSERHAAVAEVYVLSPKKFDVKKIWKHRMSGGSGRHSLRILQGNHGFLFFVIYTGGRLEPFLKLPDT